MENVITSNNANGTFLANQNQSAIYNAVDSGDTNNALVAMTTVPSENDTSRDNAMEDGVNVNSALIPGETKAANGGETLAKEAPDSDCKPVPVFDIEMDSPIADEVIKNARGQWAKNIDFILACVGCAVGIGNVWRFPYLCYKNGGGAFLIPYFICLATCGVPLFLLELALGQYMSVSHIEAWGRLAYAFKGIGIGSLVICILLNFYYILVLAWAAYYLFETFNYAATTLPWASCDNYWNTPRCFSSLSSNISADASAVIFNSSTPTSVTSSGPLKTVDPSIEFWEHKVLHMSEGIDHPGRIVPELAISLLVVWILVFFCIWRGVGWTGKVVYFTAVFPYVILTILLIRGVTLDGAAEGIKFYLKPDFTRLSDPQVWIDGGTQIFFSYAVAIGAIISLGSYNKFKTNVYRSCLIVSGINSFTSLYGGIAVFSVLGYMAKEQNVSVADVAQGGPGLVFVTYPKAMTKMPAAPLWAALFFFMILLVGLDSQFVCVEGVISPILDMFPKALSGMKKRIWTTAAYCAVSYIIGLSMVTEGGIYVFQIFDYYSASGLVLLWVSFFETFTIAWVFGASNFVDAIELMTGSRVSYWFVLCWKFLTPGISMGIFLFMLIKFTPLTYNKTYIYPDWALGFGLCMAIASIVCVPLWLMYSVRKTEGSLAQRWRKLITPRLKDHQIPDKWRKSDVHWKTIH